MSAKILKAFGAAAPDTTPHAFHVQRFNFGVCLFVNWFSRGGVSLQSQAAFSTKPAWEPDVVPIGQLHGAKLSRFQHQAHMGT